MIFHALSSANQQDIIESEARKVGIEDIQTMSNGIEFETDLRGAYRFCLNSQCCNRLLLALYKDDDIISTDELFDASVQIPWEEWIDPSKTFSVTETTVSAGWVKNSHFAALRVKDAIVDRIKKTADGERPSVDRDNPDVTFHIHIEGTSVAWFVDFSGKSLHKRGYRVAWTEAILKESLASAVLYRSDWRKALEKDETVPVLVDPFCGAGTLLIEAARTALDMAPALTNTEKFAFYRLPIHDPDMWDEVVDEAEQKREDAADREFTFYGYDIDPEAIAIAKKNAEAAGVADHIKFEVKDFTEFTAEDVPAEKAYVVTDPPYGIRTDGSRIEELYVDMGKKFNTLFGGYHISVLCGEKELLSYVNMKPDRTNSMMNGNISCQLAHYYVFSQEEREDMIRKAEEKKAARLAMPLSEGAQMAYNRLRKNLDRIVPLMEQQGVTNYRIYDADMPEYSAAIDIYAGKWISLQEYAAPATIDPEDAQKRLDELVLATERATGIDIDNIYVKQRTIQKGTQQYEKFSQKKKFYIVKENDARYLVNFTDYLDTGIFLDHRPVRKMISTMTKNRRFLNLFCYTATATVQAALGGASSTTSVDVSSTYLDWGIENLKINGLTGMNHFFYKSDVFDYLYNTDDKFDVIFCDPPTFSNGTGRKHFDVFRDQIKLVDMCMRHLDEDGVLIFSNNFRKFKLSEDLIKDYDVKDITAETIGDDFQRDMKIHNCYMIKHRQMAKTVTRRKLVRRKADVEIENN